MKRLIIAGVFFTLASCKGENDSFQEIQDTGLTVQVMALKNKDAENAITYQVRLLPNKELVGNKTNEEKNELWYRVDSCFYILSGSKKTYADMVQPIANGVSGTYEYMVDFSTNKQSPNPVTLVYEDKYLTKKTYSFKINLEN